jgi:DNA-binding PadR family transcriptional regulator
MAGRLLNSDASLEAIRLLCLARQCKPFFARWTVLTTGADDPVCERRVLRERHGLWCGQMFLIPAGQTPLRSHGMKPPRSGDLTPNMAVLGLVVQAADTAAGLALRIEQEFPDAQFSGNASHNNLPSLAKEGYVLLVKRGERPSLDLYKGTPKGETAVQTWIRESDAAPPGWRDALRGKLAFAEQETLLDVLREIREQEELCAREYAITHRRISSRRDQERRTGEPLDFRKRLADILDADDASLWGLRGTRLRLLREDVEGLVEEVRASRGGGGGG